MTGLKDTAALPINNIPQNIPTNFRPRPENNTHNRGNDRILRLVVQPGKTAISSTGTNDPRLFTGENKLHAMFDENIQLWKLKLDAGSVAPLLRQTWTAYSILIRDVRKYYDTRNVDVIEE